MLRKDGIDIDLIPVEIKVTTSLIVNRLLVTSQRAARHGSEVEIGKVIEQINSDEEGIEPVELGVHEPVSLRLPKCFERAEGCAEKLGAIVCDIR